MKKYITPKSTTYAVNTRSHILQASPQVGAGYTNGNFSRQYDGDYDGDQY